MSTRAGEIERQDTVGKVATGFGEFGERPCRAEKQGRADGVGVKV